MCGFSRYIIRDLLSLISLIFEGIAHLFGSSTNGDVIKEVKGLKAAITGVEVEEKVAASTTFTLTGALSALKLIAGGIAIGALAYGMYELATANKKTLDSSKELITKYQESSEALDENRKKIIELKDSLDSGNLSYEESKTAREDLLGIQDTLIDKYGIEAQGLDLVNGSLETELEILNKLANFDYKKIDMTKALPEWQQFLNKFMKSGVDRNEVDENGETLWFQQGQQSDFFKSGYDQTIHAMESLHNYDLDTVFSGINENGQKKLTNYIDSLYDDVSLSDDGKGLKIIAKNAEDAYAIINKVQSKYSELVKEYLNGDESVDFINNLENSFNPDLGNLANTLETYESDYDELQKSRLQRNSEYSESYAELLNYQEKFNTATVNGDTDAVNEASQAISTTLNEVIKQATENGDDSLVAYLTKTFLNTTANLRKQQFTDEYNSNQQTTTTTPGEFTVTGESLQSQVNKFKGNGLGIEDYINIAQHPQSSGKNVTDGIVENGYSEKQIQDAQALQKIAEEHNMTLEETVALLQEMGILESKVRVEAETKYAHAGNEQYNGVVQDWLDTLDDDQLELFMSLNIDPKVPVFAMKDALAQAQKVADSQPIEVKIETSKIADSAGIIGSLQSVYDKFQSNLKDKTIKVPLEISDIEGLDDSLKGLDSFKEFEKVAGSASSSTEDVQKSFDNLLNEYLYTTDALDGLNEEERQFVIDQYEAQGVTNASAIVTKDLAEASEELAKSGKKLSEATVADIETLKDEKGEATAASDALAVYVLQKQLASGTALSTSDSVSNLITLVAYLGKATDALELFQSMLNNTFAATASAQGLKGNAGFRNQQEYLDAQELQQTKIKTQLKDMLADMQGGIGSALTGSGAGSGGSGSAEEAKDVLSELSSQLDEIQSSYSSLMETMDSYNKNGKISVDQAQALINTDFRYLACLNSQNGALSVNQNAFEDLTRAKIEEMQVQLALNAIETINSLKTEADAVAWLTNSYKGLAGATLEATEAQLNYAAANMIGNGGARAEAAQSILDAYNNTKLMIGNIDYSPEGMGYTKDKKDDEDKDKEEEENTYSEEFSWIERKLDRLSKAVEDFQSSADRYFSWWKKNGELNKSLVANQDSRTANQDAYNFYMAEAKKIKVPKKYQDYINNGAIKISTITDEALGEKLQKYQDLMDKAQECLEAITNSYDTERELIQQKYENIKDYYDKIDDYLGSIAGSIDAQIELKTASGHSTTLEDLLAKYAANDNQVANDEAKLKALQTGATGDERTSSEVQKDIDSVNSEVLTTATYAAIKAQIEKLEAKEKLSKSQQASLQMYKDELIAIQENAVASNITSYKTIYEEWWKLKQKADDVNKAMSAREWKRYQDLCNKKEAIEQEKAKKLTNLQTEMTTSLANEAETLTPEQLEQNATQQKNQITDSYNAQKDKINNDLYNTETYKKIKSDMDAAQDKLDKENAKSKPSSKNLTKYANEVQKQQSLLNELVNGATASNVVDYLAKYQRKLVLEAKKKLSASQVKELDDINATLEAYKSAKNEALQAIDNQLKDKLAEIDQELESDIADAESGIANAKSEAYDLAKQIAEFNITSLQSEIDQIEAMISASKSLVSVLQEANADDLSLIGLDDVKTTEDRLSEMSQAYQNTLDASKNKIADLNQQKNFYQELIDANNNTDGKTFSDILAGYSGTLSQDTLDKVKALLESNKDADLWEQEWQTSLSNVESDLYDTVGGLQGLRDELRDALQQPILDAISAADTFQSKMSSMAGVINDDWMYDDNGITEFGLAKAQLLYSQIASNQEEVRSKAELVNDIIARQQDDSTKYQSEEAYQKALSEATADYYSALNDTYSLEQQVYDIATKIQQQEIDKVKEVTDKYKESLQAKKDYYDYDKTLKDKTKSIQALQASIESLNDIDNAEAKAKKAALQAQLDEAVDDLEDTKLQHEYDIQINAVDDLISDMQEALDGATENIAQTFEKFADTLESMFSTSSVANISDTMQSITDLIMKKFGLGSTSDSVSINTDNTTSNSSDDASVSVDIPIDDSKLSVKDSETVDAIKTLTDTVSLLTNESGFVKIDDSNFNNLSDSMQKIYEMQQKIQENTALLPDISSNLLNLTDSNVTSQSINIDLSNRYPFGNDRINININYDNLLNVEGNVDKAFMGDLKTLLQQSYNYTSKQLSVELKKLGINI